MLGKAGISLIYMNLSNDSDNRRPELSRILYYYVIGEFGLITVRRKSKNREQGSYAYE